VRWFSTLVFLACVGGAHERGEGANVLEGPRMAEVWARTADRGGHARFSGGRARLGGGHAQGSREWGQGRGFGGLLLHHFFWLLLCMIG
jgi:hypothetical protein